MIAMIVQMINDDKMEDGNMTEMLDEEYNHLD